MIKSSSIIASDAISELVGIDTSQSENKQVEFGYTTDILGMDNGREVTNQMLQAVSDFSQAILTQANRFPQIAAKIEKIDIEQAQRWVK